MNVNSYIKLLPAQFRRRAVKMVAIGIVNRLLDLVGLASLLPIIIVIINPASIEGDNSFMGQLFRFIGLDSLAQFGLILGIAALVLLPLKSVLIIWLGNIQNKYYLEIYRYYSRRLYNYYHSKGLLFIRQTYSSQLAFHINGACYGFATSIIKTILDSVSNMVMMLLLMGFLLWLAPVISMALVGAMIPISLIYLAVVRGRLKKLGLAAYEARRNQAQIVQESLKGHVCLSVNGSFDRISNQFEEGLDTISKADTKNIIYRQVPSVIFQLCIVVALIILLVAGTANGVSVNAFIIFGFVALRVMPSLLTLVSSWHVLQNNQYVIDVIKGADEDDSKEADEEFPQAIINLNRQIELRDITFAFDVNAPVFSNFSLKIHKGECIGFKGDSGAGKSTLFNLLLGFYIPQQGGIYIDGIKLSPRNRKSWHKLIGYVEQDVFIKNDSLRMNIAMSIGEPDNDRILKVLEQAGLKTWFESLQDGLDTLIGEAGTTISGGERQRIGIARALYKEPEVLFVDEATSALDAKKEEDIVSLLHALAADNFTLLIISHRERTLRFCSRIVDI
ncbi:ABC transporter ATP-binding protein [Dysgonomonas sp. 25]|uniref:ATP-binding cassette domain-containing protein n=1 Tax=Dysgonomonas sp. 25 TaxID=2302933 RepID=UPI0013D8A01F|nr:ABC transporter ATP-binding protein [Dysgonomonas sp. 25]NDV67950.1 ABC transporter ATP-binding protein [Dysgonomonas sp. 25]